MSEDAMPRSNKNLRRLWAALATGGVCLQLGSCGPATMLRFAAQFNPCGTILICDARVYEFVRSGYDGPGVDTSVDPFCTYPPYCTATEDPLYSGLGATIP
jgi:hypothetical protein